MRELKSAMGKLIGPMVTPQKGSQKNIYHTFCLRCSPQTKPEEKPVERIHTASLPGSQGEFTDIATPTPEKNQCKSWPSEFCIPPSGSLWSGPRLFQSLRVQAGVWVFEGRAESHGNWGRKTNLLAWVWSSPAQCLLRNFTKHSNPHTLWKHSPWSPWNS